MIWQGYEISYWHIPLAIAIVLNLIAILALLVRASKRTKSFWYFIAYLVAAELWALENFFETIPRILSNEQLLWAANASFSLAVIGLLSFFLFVYFIFEENRRRPNILWYVTGVTFGGIGFFWDAFNSTAMLTDVGVVFDRGYLYYAVVVVIVFLFGRTLYELVLKVRGEKNPSNRIKLNLILGGFTAVVVIGFSLGIVVPLTTGINYYNTVMPLGILIFLLLMTWGIMRYHLFEVRVHVRRSDITSFLTITALLALLFMFSVVVFWLQGGPWLFVCMVAFALIFFKLRDVVELFVDSHTFSDYLDPHLDMKASRSGVNDQIDFMRQDVKKYFDNFFGNAQVDIFYLNAATKDLRSGLPARRGMVLAQQGLFVGFVRKTSGAVLAMDISQSAFASDQEKKVVRSQLRRLSASAFIGMRHWTGELVMVAFVGFDEPSEEQIKHFKIQQQFSAPKWDEIASKIYTNMRAMESMQNINSVAK